MLLTLLSIRGHGMVASDGTIGLVRDSPPLRSSQTGQSRPRRQDGRAICQAPVRDGFRRGGKPAECRVE